MRYWRGYLAAAIFAAFTFIMMELGKRYEILVDMVYPYVTRTFQSMLTVWTSGADFLVWQAVVMVIAVVIVSSFVLVIIFRGSVIRWLGWVLAGFSLVYCLHTAVYGLNFYAGSINEDLHIRQMDYTFTELEDATEFFRDKANAIAKKLPRDEQGTAKISPFPILAKKTGEGYQELVLHRSFSVFGGDYTPVKELTWADMYSSMGITGVIVPLTGEAAVNPQIPSVALPFAMANEMAHRLCIAREDEADFAAYLSCEANPSEEYQYSGYFMAYLYCSASLEAVDPAAASVVADGCSKELTWDINAYRQFFSDKKDDRATQVANSASDAYLKTSGDRSGVRSYGAVCDLLVNWYLNEYVMEEEVVVEFNPFDETQVDLSGNVNAKPVEETTEETTGEDSE